MKTPLNMKNKVWLRIEKSILKFTIAFQTFSEICFSLGKASNLFRGRYTINLS